tara:strand:- start:18 stop:410 length:393 start_codon:yes stop_codon:yes gene_type:complete
MSILTAFNTQVQNLIDDLNKLYPNEKDINLFREKFKLIKFANPRLIIENFILYVYPYKEFIMSKNEKYFIEEDNSINRECDKNEISLTKVINFKKLWQKTSDKNKNAIWKYFQVLIVLAERWFKENALNK